MSNIRSLKGVFILLLLNFSFSQVDNVGDQSFSFEQDGQIISIPVFSNKDIQNPGNDISKIIKLHIGSFELFKLKYLPRTSNNKISYNELKKLDDRL